VPGKNSPTLYDIFIQVQNQINETSGRFTQFSNIVVAYYSVNKKHTQRTFYDFGLRPNTIFFLLIDCQYAGKSCMNPRIQMYILKCPAIKIYVFPRKYTKTTTLIGAVSANGYFQYTVAPISNIIDKGLLASSIMFHKKHFWNGNLKRMNVSVHLSFPKIMLKYRYDTYKCSQMIMNHKFYDN